MTAAIIENRLQRLLTTLECLTPDDKRDVIVSEVIETGGTYCPPPPEGSDAWASHLYELHLHGITGRGSSEAEAVRSWTKAAKAVAFPAEDDGFITVHPPLAARAQTAARR